MNDNIKFKFSFNTDQVLINCITDIKKNEQSHYTPKG